MEKPIINFWGSFGQGVGYSGAAENIIVWLEKIGYDVRAVNFGKIIYKALTPDGRRIVNKPFKKGDIGIVMGHPTSFTSLMTMPYKLKIGITMFETDSLPKGLRDSYHNIEDNWVDNCNLLDVLIVPCEHNKRVFEKEGVRVPIEVVNQGVDPRYYHYFERPERDTFTFLQLGKLTIRKNPGAVIAAFLTLFKDRPDVRLILKTVSGTLGHITMPYSNIVIVDKMVGLKETISFYKGADCFVFPSRGEGFGLPPLEAMATGIPAIFPRHTGMAEYADERYAYIIKKWTKQPAKRYPERFGDVGNWYEPDYQELKNLMAYVESHRKEARKKGKLAAEWVRKNFTYENTAKNIKKVIDKYL